MGLEVIVGVLFVGMVFEHPASKNSKINNIIEENVFILVVLFIKINLLNNYFLRKYPFLSHTISSSLNIMFIKMCQEWFFAIPQEYTFILLNRHQRLKELVLFDFSTP
jgi:hypothetical protein